MLKFDGASLYCGPAGLVVAAGAVVAGAYVDVEAGTKVEEAGALPEGAKSPPPTGWKSFEGLNDCEAGGTAAVYADGPPVGAYAVDEGV